MAYLEDDWEQPHICAYCKKEFPMTVRDYRNMIRRLGEKYCSIECEQADEQNRVKRKDNRVVMCRGKTYVI